MGKSKIRKPHVAGQFYPLSAQKLRQQISSLVDKEASKIEAIACLMPHAGYAYSGLVAAQTVSHVAIREKVILIGPNHTGFGSPLSLMTEGSWQTPLGEQKIDSALATQILSRSRYLKDDELAHTYEHSLEVELPMLQYFCADFEIVPIAAVSDDIAVLRQTGKDIASAIMESHMTDSTLIVASSDMTHYEAQNDARRKDNEAIEAILELDEEKLLQRVKQYEISMCGYAAVAIMLACAKQLGAKYSKLIKYQTSADATGDRQSVVGYAGIIIY